MGGFFGVASQNDCVFDLFFGVDYHTHLGTRRGGMAVYGDGKFDRAIHNIENTPFRTKFENIFEIMKGRSVIGCINDSDPQPLLVCSKLGNYALCFVGVVNNQKELIDEYIEVYGGQFGGQSGGGVNSTELISAFINQKSSFVEGISFVQQKIKGTAVILILTEQGNLIVARDRVGRLPVHVGKNKDGMAVSFESFAYQKLGYKDEYELGPNEIVGCFLGPNFNSSINLKGQSI